MSEFQRYGVHAIVREDGDLFVNSTAATLGEAEGREFLGFLMTEYHERDVAAGLVDEEPDEEDVALVDGVNDLEYTDGDETAVETEQAEEFVLSPVDEKA